MTKIGVKQLSLDVFRFVYQNGVKLVLFQLNRLGFLAWTRRFKLISQREGPLERCKVFGMEILNFISFPKKKSWYTNFWMHDQIKASAVETANRNKRESRFQGRIRNLTLYSLDSLDSLETATSKLKTQAIKTVFYVLPRCIDADRF